MLLTDSVEVVGPIVDENEVNFVQWVVVAVSGFPDVIIHYVHNSELSLPGQGQSVEDCCIPICCWVAHCPERRQKNLN